MSYLGQQLGQGQAERFVFTASGGETSVTTSDDGRAIAYTIGQVDVYLNGAKLINGSDFTATTGTSITGLSALTASDVVEVFALSIFQASDTVSAASGGTFNGNVTVDANLTVTGTTTLAGASTTADITFGDNDKAIFGAGSDLQIYHDGANSYIVDNGTGLLAIRGSTAVALQGTNGENAVIASENGAVDIRYDNATKLATTSTGIDVTGTVTADGLTVENTDATITLSGTRGTGDTHTIATAGVNSQVLNISADDSIYLRTSDTVNRIGIASGGDISFYEDTGTTPKFFWDASAEHLGIGTSSPAYQLEIAGNQPWIRLNDTDGTTAYAEILTSSGSLAFSANPLGTGGNSDITFSTDGTERMRITSAGRVGIGNDTSGAAERFQVSTTNDLNAQGYAIATKTSGTGTINHFRMINGNGVVGSITTNASTTSYNTSSDYRLKDIDGPITNSGAYIDALKPVQGSWKADGSRFIGLIAHEVQEVSETPIAIGEKDGEEMQGMSYSAPELIANLIAEIQSLRARVAQLEGA